MGRKTKTAALARRGVPFPAIGGCLLALTTLAPALGAQSVRGVVTRGATPIPGVVVQLLDSTAAIVARTLTDDAGVYRLLAPRSGTYRLSTRRIGFAPTTSATVVLGDGESRDLPLRVDGIAISLDTVRVRSDRAKCARADADNAEVTAVWEQARTTLMATEASLVGRAISASLLNYRRTRHADGSQELQSLSMLEADSVAQPWTSPPFEELQRTGYVIAGKDSTVYRAPGLDVLISSGFSNAHCFRVVAGADSTQVALSFEPAKPRKGISELRGVLRLDRRSAELRTLEFGYTNLGAILDTAGAGGRMEFVGMRDGSWAIARWNIVMPIVASVLKVNGTGPRARAMSQALLQVASTETGGGDLLVARRGPDTLWARTLPPVAGAITDSATGATITGARLRLRDTDWRARSDSAGRFEFLGVLPGDYAMLINTPSLDSVGATTMVPLLVADTVATLRVRVPGASRVLPLVCAIPADSLARRGEFGLVRGHATFAEPPASPTSIDVTIRWRDSATKAMRTRRARADVSGRYRLCDVPVGAELEVQAEASAYTSATSKVRTSPASPYAQVDLALERLAPNQAVLRGVVVDASGNPVDDVTVEIGAPALRVVTDDSGAFRLARVPAGKQRVTLRRVGYAAEEAELTVVAGEVMERRFTLTRVTTLSEVSTTASTEWIRDFEEHRRIGLGTFFTREELEKQAARRLSDIMSTVGGVKIIPMAGGKAALSSSRRPPSLSGGTCFALIYLDKTVLYGGRAGEPVPDLNSLMVADMEAMEYFTGPAETPAEYSGLQSPCGVLVIHTRR